MAQQRSVENRIDESTLRFFNSHSSVTVKGVAAASGVAKTTIYRRYRDGATFCRRRSRSPHQLPLDTADGHTPDRLRWLIRHAVETIEDGVGLGGVAAMLTDEDPEFNALFRQILVEQRRHLARGDRCEQKQTGRCGPTSTAQPLSTQSSALTLPNTPQRNSQTAGKSGCSICSGQRCSIPSLRPPELTAL